MRCRWAILLLGLCARLAWAEFELGEWNQAMPAAEAVPAAKALALRNGRPLLVMAGHSRTCYFCREADAGVFSDEGWKTYARAKGIPQYYADGAFADSNLVKNALHAEYDNPEWPTILIFRIKDTADLTTTDLDEARNVELIGKFVYREGRTVNGITIPAPTPASFITILESFYRTTHPAWLNDAGGSLTVAITPPAAVDAGARWSVDGGATWREPGTVLPLAVGTVTLTCSPLAGWNTPVPRAVAVVADQEQAEIAAYTPITTGTLTVTLAPAAAVAAGARWSVDAGATWLASGASLTLEQGAYTVSFKTVSSWGAPASLLRTVEANATAVIPAAGSPAEATYIPGPDDADPADDVPAGATPLPLAAGVITASTPRSLNGEDCCDWFSFEAEAGRGTFFVAKNYAVPPGTDISFSIYSSMPGGAAIPVATLNGMAALVQGFGYQASENGTHYAAVTRPVDAAISGLTYTLTATPVDATPEAGDMTNPLWSGAAVGKWTMDYEAAAATGKPMLLLFTGIRWCPYCIAMDAIAIGTAEFQNYVNDHDLVLVMIDNARRTGDGPTLLREESYLAAHGLTAAEGEAKLAANLAFQQSLVLPGSTRIGYPTVLYARPGVVGAAPSVVGRVNYDVLSTDLNAFLTQLGQLEELAADPAEERDNYAGWTQAALVTPTVGIPVTLTPRMGGLDSVDWRVFTPAEDTGWSFTVRADADRDPVGARVTVGVYDASGTATAPGNKLAEISGDFAAGVTLQFRPPAYGGAAYRLCVQVAGQSEVVDYTLTYSTSVLSYEARFAAPSFAAAQDAEFAALEIDLTEIISNGTGAVLRYWTEDLEGGAQAGVEYAAVLDGRLSWTPGETVRNIYIPLRAGGLAPWSGSRDFCVHIAAFSNCKVVGSGSATVRIYSRPAFTDAPLFARTVSTGARLDVRLGIANGMGGALGANRVSGDLPPGLSQTLDPVAGEVILSGRPTRPGTYRFVLQAQTTVGGLATVGGQITVDLTVKPVAEINPAGVGSFVGTLFEAGTPAVRGTVTLKASSFGRLMIKVALRSRTYSFTVLAWSRVDEDGTLWAELTDVRRGAVLSFSLALSGRATGSFWAEEGIFDVQMERVPWHRVDNPASEYAGYYTVSLPVEVPGKAGTAETLKSVNNMPYGGGYLVFLVAADGKTTYSGKLADGTRVRGSTVLVERTAGSGDVTGVFTVFMPLYARSGHLAGRLAVQPLSRRLPEVASVSACAPYAFFEWSYPGQSPGRERTADAFTVTVAPCGTLYPKGSTLEDHSITAAELTTAEAPTDAAYAYRSGGETRYVYPVLQAFPLRLDLAVSGRRLTAPAATKPVRQPDRTYVYNGTNDSGLRIAYSASTGVFSGSFKLYYDYQTSSWQHKTVTVRFTGVLTPIPGACCTEDPLPLGHGFFLVPDHNAEAGYTFKRSYPVWLGEVVPEP